MSETRGHEASVRIELARAMRRQAPMSALSATSMALFIAWVSWGAVGHAVTVGWTAAVIVLKAVQIGAQHRWFGSGLESESDVRRWQTFYFAFITATGGLWAAAPFLFVSADAAAANAYVLAALIALGAGSVPALMYHRATMVAFLTLVFVPLTIRLFVIDGVARAALGAGSLVFLAGFGWFQGRVARESIRLRHENLDLLADVRRQKDATEAALRSAEEANRAKSKFFAAASHDLRQPLHALALFSSALRELNPEPEKRVVVDQVYASIEALEALFDEVLDLAKLDAGYVEPQTAHFPIAELLDSLRQQFGPVAVEAGLSLRVTRSAVVVCSDLTLLGRILSNLVANAIRYTPAGAVMVACRSRGPCLRIEVRDSGIGIAADEQDRVFEEFVQLANPERDQRKGLGLGLTIVRRLSLLLGHPLELRSALGRGTVFLLSVPLGDRNEVRPAAAAASARLDVLAGKRIVLVDDDPAIRRAMDAVLTRWGCLAVTAATAAEAIDRLCSAGAPDLIICDWQLAGAQTGTVAIRCLRDRYGAHIPALLISADASPQRLREARQAGHVLQPKPVRPAQLRAACNLLLATPHRPLSTGMPLAPASTAGCEGGV